MKIAVIGTGKTGGAVLELMGSEGIPFDSKHPPTVEKLKKADVAIVFVPGSAAEDIIEPLLRSGIPAVWGTTGYQWPQDLNSRVQKANTQWVIGTNFSLGMNLVRKAIEILGRGAELLKDPEFHIHEVHHVHKKDAPSGTALSWEQWLGQHAEITSSREGDVKGIHELHIRSKYESIHLKHEAHHRELFAEGAIWTARKLFNHSDIKPGVYKFESFFDQIFKP